MRGLDEAGWPAVGGQGAGMDAIDYGLAELEALVSPIGQELLGRLAQVELTPESELRVGALLRRDYPVDLVAAVLGQHELRRRARMKFTSAQRMYFTRAGLEQATSEVIARYRARRFAGSNRVADLCCGIGGDLIDLADRREVLAVDRDPVHLRMATLRQYRGPTPAAQAPRHPARHARHDPGG